MESASVRTLPGSTSVFSSSIRAGLVIDGTLEQFMVILRTLHVQEWGVSRGAYASIRPPLIELLADMRELHLLPFLSGTQVYADEQDFPRQEQDQVPSSRRRPPVRGRRPQGCRLQQHRVPHQVSAGSRT